jgi:hypothetical protein
MCADHNALWVPHGWNTAVGLAADLALTLRSPDGKEVELSSGNGGSGSDYR